MCARVCNPLYISFQITWDGIPPPPPFRTASIVLQCDQFRMLFPPTHTGSQRLSATGLDLDETLEEAVMLDEELFSDDTDSDLDSNNDRFDGLDLDETLEEAIFDDELFYDATDGNSDNPQCDDHQSDRTDKRPKLGKLGNESEDLYKGSNVAVFQAYLMIFQFALKHHLTTCAFSELLLLLKVLLPQASQLPRTVYMLKAFFWRAYPDLKTVEHCYCQWCHTLIDSGGKCTNPLCTCDKVNKFITVPLGPQLKEMMQGMSVCICARYMTWCTI